MKLIKLFLYIILISHNTTSWAYNPETHKDISEEAALQSLLQTSDLLPSLGLQHEIKSNSLLFPNSEGSESTILTLFSEGAEFEDDGLRPFNHFYDPVNNHPLPVPGYNSSTSPEWALAEVDHFFTQDNSFWDANQYLYEALTLPNTHSRKNRFGLVFQSLGQVIHHIQDMAQPQHVRLDKHCDNPWVCVPTDQFNPSLYEKYTLKRQRTVGLPYNSYPIVDFKLAVRYWHTNEETINLGEGIADYTNRGFVSAGTIPSHPDYPQPQFNGFWHADVNTLFSQTDPPITVPQGCQDSTAPCYITFLSNELVDNVTGSTETNLRAASYSIFDQDLEIHNVDVTFYTLFGDSYNAPRIYALNRFNFDSAHEFLIPRAVGYATGIINYFFRGRLDVTNIEEDVDPDQQIPVYRITIKNTSNAGNPLRNGSFELLYENTSGHRRPMTILNPNNAQFGTIGVTAGEEIEITAAIPSDRDGSKDMVAVFKGDIRTEPGVAAKTFTPPASPDIFVLDISNGSKVYQFTATGILKDIKTAPNGVGLSVYGNQIYAATGLNRNDTSVNDSEVYRSFAGSDSAWVDIYDHQGALLRQLPVSPGYYWFGGEIRVSANNTHFATTNSEEVYIYTTDGTQVGKISGIDINNQEVSITKDRVYIVNAGLVEIYSLDGTYKGTVSSTKYWSFASLAVTEKYLFITETQWNGWSQPRTNLLHIYNRNVTRDNTGNITSDTYTFTKTVDFSLISDQPRFAAVDRSKMELD